MLDKGYRIEGIPGQNDYQITYFEEYGSRLRTESRLSKNLKTEAISTRRCLAPMISSLQATLQWRLSIPLLLVMVVTLLGSPLKSHQ